MISSERTEILGRFASPVLVVDPSGCVVFANEAYQSGFRASAADPLGAALSRLFEGPALEALSVALAEVLDRRRPVPVGFGLGKHTYTALASLLELELEHDQLFVVFFFREEQGNGEDLRDLTDQLGDGLEAALQSVLGLSERASGALLEEERALLENAVRRLETSLKSQKHLADLLSTERAQPGRFDVANVVARVRERVIRELASGVEIEVLMPPNLPRAAGSALIFERVLLELVRQRVEESRDKASLTILGRQLRGGGSNGVLVSVVDLPDPERRVPTGRAPESLQHALALMGGSVVCVEDSLLGRATTLRLTVSGT
jgi:hypothetical protein